MVTRELRTLCLVLLLAVFGTGVTVRAAEPITLRFSGWYIGESLEEPIRELLDKFEEENPGIRVVYEPISGGTDGFRANIVTWAAAGVLPDVLQVPHMRLEQWARSGILQDLSFLIMDPVNGLDLSQYIPQTVDAVTWDERIWGIPFAIDFWGVPYNKTAFMEAALVPPADLERAGDWSVDQMVQYALKMTSYSPQGQLQRIGIMGFLMAQYVAPWFWAYGTDLFNEDGTATTITDPAAVEVLGLLQRLVGEQRVMLPPKWQDASFGIMFNTAIAGGQYAMANHWNSGVGLYASEASGFEVGWTPFPPGPVNDDTVLLWVHSYGISSTTKYPAEAWRLIKFLAEHQDVWEELGHVPVRFQAIPLYQQILDEQNMPGGEFFGTATLRFRPYKTPIDDNAIDMITREFGPLWRLEVSPQEAAERAARVVNAMLSRAASR